MRKSILLFVAAALIVAAAGQACEICSNSSDADHTHIWCILPPSDSWGFDECTMGPAPDGGETCRTGYSRCYYTEYNNGGNGTDGGRGLNDPNRDDSGACPAEYASCG